MFAKKSLGQNFLMHQQTAERIADAAHLAPTDTVLEIGPGTGMLTRTLLARAGKVIAVEADASLTEELRTTFADDIGSGKFDLRTADVRVFDPAAITEPYAIVANIPYYITGEIIRSFLTAAHKPTSITLLVQKEVAERIARSTKESLLSLSVKAYGTPRYAFTVPKGAFKPAPKVDSAVLSITNITNPFATPAEETMFFKVLHAGFAHKRKQLGKNLGEAFTQESAASALASVHLSTTARAEDVPLAIWLALTKEFLCPD